MGLFEKKSPAEKQRKAAVKEAKKDAREERKEIRQDARDEKKDARQDARAEKKEAREDARDEKKDAREQKREEMKEIRHSDLKGEAKRDAKADVRDEKRDAIRDAKDEKRDAIDVAVDEKKDRKSDAQDAKKDALEENRADELARIVALSIPSVSRLNAALGLELLALTHTAQFQDAPVLTASPVVRTTMFGATTTCTLRGATVRNATAITAQDFKSDLECFVARSDDGDVVVAFRGSETAFFDQVGAFKDWVLTDFRANRIAYSPAPKSWPDQRWVHAGFWQCYNLVRNALLGEVSRQAATPSTARRIYVTGFSLGGALALLAALDIADGVRSTKTELFTFAAPRVGDASLNKLLAERVDKSTLVAFRGDPVVHLPPFGPNFPVTLRHPINLDIAGIHVGLGKPVIPQVNQQYRTADNLFYIDRDGVVHESYPTAQVALRFNDHDWPPYADALGRIASAQARA